MPGQVSPVVFHIPHSSTLIPSDLRGTFLLSDTELWHESVAMTDRYTDELFDLGAAAYPVTFPVCRLVVDPERFLDDSEEPMAAFGMGVVYDRTSTGEILRAQPSGDERQALLERFYVPHHAALTSAVESALSSHGSCLLVDCHSFPAAPRSHELDPMVDRPDICLGTDAFHTPDWLLASTSTVFRSRGLSVAVNRPYKGTLVPIKFYETDSRVSSIMVEVNRWLFMDETRGDRLPGFAEFADQFRHDLRTICDRAVEQLVGIARSGASPE